MTKFNKIKNYSRYSSICAKELIVSKSSLANYDLDKLANARDENQQITDLVTTDSIPNLEIRSPKILLIGHYAFLFRTVIKTIFRNCEDENALIRHPIENRSLNPIEQEKLITDLAALLCIDDKQKLLGCWNLSSDEIEEMVNDFVENMKERRSLNSIEQAQLRGNCRKIIRPTCRFKKFLEISPLNLSDYLGKEVMDFFAQLRI